MNKATRRDLVHLRRLIKSFDTLANSLAWEYIIKEVVQKETTQLYTQIANNPEISQQRMDWLRGAIWSAGLLPDIPTKILAQLKNDEALIDAQLKLEEEESKD